MKIKIAESNRPKRINQKSHTKKVEAETIRLALGAKEVTSLSSGQDEMFTFAKLFQSAVEKVRSKGGRPGRVGDIERKKIPLTSGEWKDLEEISTLLHSFDIHVSTGQVAGLLIENSIHNVKNTLAEIQTAIDKEGKLAAKNESPTEEIKDVKEYLKKELIKDKISKLIPNLILK